MNAGENITVWPPHTVMERVFRDFSFSSLWRSETRPHRRESGEVEGEGGREWESERKNRLHLDMCICAPSFFMAEQNSSALSPPEPSLSRICAG